MHYLFMADKLILFAQPSDVLSKPHDIFQQKNFPERKFPKRKFPQTFVRFRFGFSKSVEKKSENSERS